MKRLFTLAIVAMIASLTFAQAPVQKKAAAKAQIEKVAGKAQMQKAMEAKAAMTAKAQAAQETSTSVLRKAATRPVAAAMQMKAPKLLSAVAMQNVRPVTLGQYSAPAKSFAPAKAVVADGMSAYIQENVTGQFVSNGAYWGTRSVLSDNGILYRISAGSEGKYILFSGIKDDTKALRDNDGFNDQSGEWTLVAAQDGGYYMVNRNQEYYTKKAGSDIPGFTTNQEEASIWNFITPDERALELASASASNPVDATYLIKGADFLNADIANAAWNKSKVGGDTGSGCTLINSTNCEQWNAGAVDINQTLTNIPNGIYRLKAFGFVRQNGASISSVTSYEEGTETPAYLYANDQETKLKSVFDDAYTESRPTDFAQVTSEASGKTYNIPNGQGTAAFAFENGKYLSDEIEVEVTDGTLKVGVKCDGVEWLVFDNFRLTYLGAASQTDPAVVTKDAHGIITNVTGGEARLYARATNAFYAYVSNQQVKYAYQSGNVDVIVDGNDFYIKDINCNIGVGTWVKGTLNEDGTKLVIPAGQMIYWAAQGGYGMTVNMGDYTTSGWIKSDRDITYTVDGNTLSLDGAHASVSGGYINFEDAVLGTFWTDDQTFAGYGDWNTVLTYDSDYVAPVKELVELPEGAQPQQWYMSGSSLDQDDNPVPFQNQMVNVAIVGNDVYAQGLFEDLPTAWIKGTKEGNTVTFKKFQFLGTYASSYDIWFIGSDGESITDATATLSEDGETLTFSGSVIANADLSRLYYLTWLDDVVISAKAGEEAVITELMGTLPYANSFDTEAEQEEAAIYDANNDGKTFTFNAPGAGDNTTPAARYAYSTKNAGDDYVVFPGLTLTAGTSYKVSVDARSYGGDYPERFEVVCGTEAKASKLTTSVIEPTDVANATYATFTVDFTPEADGVYYFAIHAISDADMFYLYTDNFSVKENNMAAPAAIADLVVTPDENAGLSAVIAFTAPAKTLAGDDITEQVTYSIKRDNVEIKTNAVAAGAKVSYYDEDFEAPGTYTYTVTATVGELTSDAAKATVYVGEDTPDEVQKLVASDLNGKVGLDWDAPANGINGGVIIPEKVWYNVYPVEIIEFFGMQFPDIDFENPYMTGLTATEAEVEFDTNAGEQAYSYFGVTAENIAGESQGMMAAVLTGAPYELPVVEEFPNGKLTYWWGVDYDDAIYEADGGLGVTTDGELEFNAPVEGWIELYSGKVALNGADKPQLSFQYKGDGKLTATVYGPTKKMNGVEFTAGADYQTATVDLAELANEPWVRLTLHADYEAAGVTNVDNIIFMNAVENDLDIAVSAPATVVAGQTAVVKATVTNKGTADASDYAVKFYVNEEEVETVSEVPTLKFFESDVFEYTLETSIFAEAGDLTVKAEVVYTADAVEANNADEAVVTVVAPSATPVQSVVAENVEGGVKIDWTVAENVASEITEDFESYEVGIVADGETMGPWSAKDGDQGMTYGWSSESINWPYTGEKYAFGIMNFPTVFGAATDIEAASGDQALMFMSVTNAQGNGIEADDWFISPELPGIAQTIKFKACPMTANYGAETVEVMASTDGENWSKVATYDIDEENTWTECTGNLPEGTKYFALHYVSNDIFALFIDDVTYTAAGADATGFNIYVDETQVASVAADVRTYTYTGELPYANHKFSVTAVYGQKESAPVSADIVTAIYGVAGTKTANEAYTISGIRMDAKNLKKGVYVVNGKKVVK